MSKEYTLVQRWILTGMGWNDPWNYIFPLIVLWYWFSQGICGIDLVKESDCNTCWIYQLVKPWASGLLLKCCVSNSSQSSQVILKKTCYTWSLWCVEVDAIIFVRSNHIVRELCPFEILIYPYFLWLKLVYGVYSSESVVTLDLLGVAVSSASYPGRRNISN